MVEYAGCLMLISLGLTVLFLVWVGTRIHEDERRIHSYFERERYRRDAEERRLREIAERRLYQYRKRP